ncbi:MAG: M48 family metallopeptidase [Armatimonadota bacterium]
MRFATRFRAVLMGAVLLLAMLARAQDPGGAVEKANGLDPDFATNLRVEMIGQRVALAAGQSNIHFAVYNDKELNAFALPDGRIYVTSLMAHAVTDDELAFVLGHEITHVKEGHAKHQAQRATGGAILGAILVAVLGGSQGSIRMGADILGGLTLGHYSRKDENKADVGGLQWMTRAGYDPRQAAAAMQRLIDKYGGGDAKVPVLGWFATHPDTRDRRENLEKNAATVLQAPPATLGPPQGIAVTLLPGAEHAKPWAYNYFSLAMASGSAGRAVVMPPMLETALPAAPAPAASLRMPVPALVNYARANDEKDEKKEEPLPPVTVKTPEAPIAYRVSLDFAQVPAGRAATLETAEGTAVQVTLRWTDVAGGFTGTLTAVSQTKKKVPWQAQEQVADPAELSLLSDGKNDNMEGTVEAAALRRIARAFSEMLLAGGPVDHSVPVTLKLSEGSARPGDYIAVVRKNRLVGEVVVDQINKKNVTGTVLWGTHLWKKGDKFIPLSM